MEPDQIAGVVAVPSTHDLGSALLCSEDCVLKIVSISIKGLRGQGLGRWESSHGRKRPLLSDHLRAKHNLQDTTKKEGVELLVEPTPLRFSNRSG